MKTKTTQEWQLELSRCIGDIALQNCIREIQSEQRLADAAFARAAFADPGWNGHYKQAAESIAAGLETRDVTAQPNDTLCDPAHGDAGKPETL